MAESPAPFVPAEVDLRGYEFMPLFGDRLFKSETWIRATAEGKVAALRLWWQAYAHEAPAASLPDDDTLLADYAGYGVSVKAWRKVKEQAMRGWELCADGRWYHRVVADLALKAWEERLKSRERQRKWRERNAKKDSDGHAPETPHKPSPKPLPNGNATDDRRGQDNEKTGKELTLSPPDGGVRPCPHGQIIDLYHKRLPTAPRVKPNLWDGARKAHLQARWREDRERQNIDWWDQFFEHVSKSDFLCGRVKSRDGRAPFHADLEWIVDKTNFARILEGGRYFD